MRDAGIRATAPGKLILAGEHAAVYGRPALVAALDLRTRVTMWPAPGAVVELSLPDVGCEESTTWPEIVRYGERARGAWEAYRQSPGAAALARLTRGAPGHVVRIALAETLRELGAAPHGLRIHVASDLPVGAGFGSSASVAVATIGACSIHLTGEVRPSRVGRIALETERRQHGLPSGADHSTVLHGGVQWFETDGAGERRRRTLAFDRHLLDRFAVFHTGTPAASTGELVESVRRRFADAPDELERLLDDLERDTRDLRGALASGTEGARGVRELLGSLERGLEALGVVPAAVREAIRAVEGVGGAAKVSGAGALAGDAAGALVAYPGRPSLEAASLSGYERLDVGLGAAGLELHWDVEGSDA